MVEYALLVALLAVVCIGAVSFLGGRGNDQIDKAGTAVAGEDEEEGPPCINEGSTHLLWFEAGKVWHRYPGPCP